MMGRGVLAPDWERIGTDVTHQGPFTRHSLSQVTSFRNLPLFLLFGIGLLGLGAWGWKHLTKH
jgi:hypothetical protein